MSVTCKVCVRRYGRWRGRRALPEQPPGPWPALKCPMPPGARQRARVRSGRSSIRMTAHVPIPYCSQYPRQGHRTLPPDARINSGSARLGHGLHVHGKRSSQCCAMNCSAVREIEWHVCIMATRCRRKMEKMARFTATVAIRTIAPPRFGVQYSPCPTSTLFKPKPCWPTQPITPKSSSPTPSIVRRDDVR